MSKDFAEDLEQRIELAEVSEQQDALIGQKIGDNYVIDSLLGEGGMGKVYLAHHVLLNERCAIKFLPPTKVSERNFSRFKAEAKAAVKLKHPRLSALNDFGISQNGQPYIVMEYVEGTALSDLIKNGEKQDPERAIKITLQLCEALAYAHDSGVLHRDIKPSNVMIKQDKAGDQAKLIDFGLAKVFSEDEQVKSALTQTGETLGSPGYMSPEQFQGMKVDKQSDVYSLGCLLYELLNASLPFTGESALAIMVNQLNESPAPFSNSKVSSELKSVVLRCLERDPKNRYQDMFELKDDLEKVLRGEKPQKGMHLPSLSQKQAYKLGIRIFTAVCLIFAVGIFCYFKFMNEIDRANWVVTMNPGTAEALISRARLYDRLGEHRKAVADLNRAIEINPNDVMAYVWRSSANWYLGVYEEALNDANHAIKIAPSNHQGWLQKACADEGLGRYRDAIDDCNTVIKLNPKNLYNNNYAAYLNLSIALTSLGEYDKALAASKKALALSENDGTYNQVAFVYLKLNQPERCLEAADASLKLKETDVALCNKAEALLNLHRADEALTVSERALQYDSANARALAIRGASLLALGHIDEAIKDSQRANAIDESISLASETLSKAEELKSKSK